MFQHRGVFYFCALGFGSGRFFFCSLSSESLGSQTPI
nr:MAG TPA: hypothetical protein [Caudoviricetes sp.]